MTFGEKLSRLRKENNCTQEQLAELLEVSRQSVSKWESDIAYPETEKLIRLAKLFDCSTDYLLREDCTDRTSAEKEHASDGLSYITGIVKRQLRERKSEKTVFGMPLYHVARNAHGFFAVGLKARGVIAVGLYARGVISLGGLSMGVLSLGLLSIGLLALGTFALGLLAFGAIALGIFTAGAISVGVVSFGALSIGAFSVGAMSVGKYIAVGDYARAMIAIGNSNAVGTLYQHIGDLESADLLCVTELLDETVPWWLSWAKELIRFYIL